jgi:hypothetical protein
MNFRPRLSLCAVLALVALAACTTDGPLEPVGQEREWVLIPEEMLMDLSSLDSSQLRAVDQMLNQVRDGARAPPGPQSGPAFINAWTPMETTVILYITVLWLYENSFLRDDQALAILYPIVWANVALQEGDDGLAIAGFENTIEWIEQRVEEELIPADIGQLMIDLAADAIIQLGGPNTTKTFCLTSEERSCVTAVLHSIRWDLPSRSTRLARDFSYTFLDGDPPGIEAFFTLKTTGCFKSDPTAECQLIGGGDSNWATVARQEPLLTANPNEGGVSLVPIDLLGLLVAFQWDGMAIRDIDGNLTASCSRSAGDPCWEP